MSAVWGSKPGDLLHIYRGEVREVGDRLAMHSRGSTHLASREADGDDAQVLWVREELGLDHAGVELLVVVVAPARDAGLALLVAVAVCVDGGQGHGAVVDSGGRHCVVWFSVVIETCPSIPLFVSRLSSCKHVKSAWRWCSWKDTDFGNSWIVGDLRLGETGKKEFWIKMSQELN